MQMALTCKMVRIELSKSQSINLKSMKTLNTNYVFTFLGQILPLFYIFINWILIWKSLKCCHHKYIFRWQSNIYLSNGNTCIRCVPNSIMCCTKSLANCNFKCIYLIQIFRCQLHFFVFFLFSCSHWTSNRRSLLAVVFGQLPSLISR